MAERIEEPEAGLPESPVQDSPAAVAIALGRTTRGSGAKAVDAEAVAFLRKQSRLIDLQTEHLHEQREVILARLRLGRWKDRASLALQGVTALVGLVIAGAVGVMAWQAHEDHGVAIAAFSVPPDFAQKGLNGQVVASQVLDRLSELQIQTVTDRPASTYANDWGGDIKVEIPETGVSLGELNRFLREWLGSQTRITGEVVRTAGEVAVTARAGEVPGRRFEGQEAEIGKLVDQAAEAIYADTQPYRYAVWLSAHGRRAEAYADYARLAKSGPAEERAWAYAGWATMLFQERRLGDAARMADNALRLNPRLHPPYPVLGSVLYQLGRQQTALDRGRSELALLESRRFIGLPNSEGADLASVVRGTNAFMVGDAQTATAHLEAFKFDNYAANYEGQANGFRPAFLTTLTQVLDHDASGARRTANALGEDSFSSSSTYLQAEQDWGALASLFDAARGSPAAAAFRIPVVVGVVAEAYARTGRLGEAEAMLSDTAPDCYPCLRARGLVAALTHDWPAADRWYAEAARQGPSLPFAQAEWGRALADKGDLDGAIGKFEEARRISPRFPDTYGYWGEALMRKGDYAGAVAKFAEADKYAPRWGRNHMRWGEALMLSGRYREARAQYETASGLDLSRPDRAALDVLLDRTAKGALHG
jgi:tetratricopeptide (TPR) repeat protein